MNTANVTEGIHTGSYICQWRIAAAQLVFSVGPPAPFVAPAPREHGTPPLQGFGNPTVIIPPSTLITPLEVPVAEGLGAAALRVLAGLVAAPVLVPAALTLALILAASPPAHAPGLPRLPVNPDELRLRELVARHAAGTLTADEEAELVALLGKVKGVHIQRLEDLNSVGPEHVGQVPTEISDLGRKALAHRITTNNWHDGNIAVFEYRDAEGNLRHLVQSTIPTSKRHAERLALESLRRDGVPFASVTRIYSELEPCHLTGGGLHGEGCKAMLSEKFPKAKVTYSYEYKGRSADTAPARAASLEKRRTDFKKYQRK